MIEYRIIKENITDHHIITINKTTASIKIERI